MSNLSELLPAGAGAKSADFVASGTLGSGVTVALKADGTVSAVSSEGFASEVGSDAVFDSTNSANWTSAAYDPDNNKVVVIYGVGSSLAAEPRAVVGTISGTSISFGTPVAFDTSVDLWTTDLAYDTVQDKFLVAYSNYANSFYGHVIVGTVSGDSISFGTRTIYSSNAIRETQAVYNPASGLTSVVYSLNSSSGRASQFTISGTTASSPGTSTFESGDVNWTSVTYDSINEKIIIFYSDNNNSNKGTVLVATASGNNLTFGTPYVLSGQVSYTNCAFDPDTGKVIIVYNDDASPNGKAAVGTVSGTSISFGTPVVYNSGTTWNSAVDYDSYAKRIVVAYRDNADGNKGKVVDGVVSGTTITFGTTTIFKDNSVEWLRVAYDPSSNATAIIYGDFANSYYGTSNVYKATSSNNVDFIGITDQAIADTATGAVIVQGGVSEKLSGLTVGADYYVQDDGSLSPTAISTDVPFDISNATYDAVSFSTLAQDNSPRDVIFNNDGTKMFIVGGTDAAYQYSLSSAFDISTASYDSVTYDFTSEDTQPQELVFNSDGTKLFMVGSFGDSVYEYTLPTPYSLVGMSYASSSFSVASQEATPTGLAFSNDGTKMYVCGLVQGTVFQYSLSTAFTLSSASYNSISLDVSSQESETNGLAFSANGNKLFVVGQNADAVFQYNLTTSFDLSTAVYSGISFDVSSQQGQAQGITFNAGGEKMYITGVSPATIFQYSSISIASAPVGKALSTTSILLTG